MQISMYRASVPVFARALRNLVAILRKAEANAAERKIDPAVLLNYRIAPDMFALTRQVQIATDMAKGCVSRLAGAEIPSYEDKEATFGELVARVEKCIALSRELQAGTDRRHRGQDHRAEAPDGRRQLPGPAVPARVRDTERVFPLHDNVLDPASLRRGHRQEGFHRRAVTLASSPA